MRCRILALCLLALSPALFGCAKPSMGDPPDARDSAAASRQTAPDAVKTQQPDAKKPAVAGTNGEKPADAKKATSLHDDLAKHGYRWADPKESDFPLLIEMESPPVPEEIKGPFPADAPWRTTEKQPEKKPQKSFWPW
jgi:hypothetical protein